VPGVAIQSVACHCPSLETGAFYHGGSRANKTSALFSDWPNDTFTMHTSSISVQGLEIGGSSLGGIETHLVVPQLRLAVDVGRGPRELVRCEHIALTHTHVDHAAGLPYLVAMRSFFRLSPPTIYAPEACIDDLRELIAGWNRLQRVDAEAQFVGMKPGDTVRIRKDIELSAFRTRHVVPSLGYTVTKRVDKLAPEFIGKEGHELRDLKAQGITITQSQRQPLLSVTGDTLVEVLDDTPDLMESAVVVLECTFLDDSKPYAAARQGGHIHLNDLMERTELLRCPRLILSHFSQLHGWDEIPALLAPLAEAIEGELWAWPTQPNQAPKKISADPTAQ
jgi:ribonuclease Z